MIASSQNTDLLYLPPNCQLYNILQGILGPCKSEKRKKENLVLVVNQERKKGQRLN